MLESLYKYNISDISKAIYDIKGNGKKISLDTKKIVNNLFFSFDTNIKKDNPDIILVLGSKALHRAITASNISNDCKIPILFSGGVIHKEFDMNEAYYYKKIAIDNGSYEKLLYVEDKSNNTYENFLFSIPLIKRIVKKDNINVLVVSNATHLIRAIKLANSINEDDKINFIPYPSYGSWNNKERWFLHPSTRKNVYEELEKLLKYNYITNK